MNLSNLPYEIIKYIYKFLEPTMYLRTNIINDVLVNLDKINTYKFWNGLNNNINGIQLLQRYPHKINNNIIFTNRNAGEIVYDLIFNKNLYYSLETILKNPGMIKVIEKILEKDSDKFTDENWYWLSINESSVKIFEKYPDKLNYIGASYNKNIIHLLEQNIEKTLFVGLLYNENVFKSTILRQYIENKINNLDDIYILMRNKSVIEIMFNDEIILDIINNNTNIDWKIIIKYLDIFNSTKIIDKICQKINMIDCKSQLLDLVITSKLLLNNNIYNSIKNKINYIDFYLLGCNPYIFILK